MSLSLRKINKNKVNNLKKFFENLVCSNETNHSIQVDKNNNNSNEISPTFEHSKSREICEQNKEALIKTEFLSDSLHNEKTKIDIKKEEEMNKKLIISKKNEIFQTSDKTDQFSVRSLSNCTLVSNFLSDQETIGYNNKLSEVNSFSSTANKSEQNIKGPNNDPKPNNFSFNLFKLLKLMLTAKCYCVLLTEKQNSNDLKKLIFILYEMKQTALKKLTYLDSSEFEDAKLNDFLLADLFNLLCEIHVNLIFFFLIEFFFKFLRKF